MFSAGRILRQNRRLSSLPAGGGVIGPTRQRPKEKRKFRCYMPFMWSALALSFFGLTVIVTGTAMCVAGWYLGHFGADDLLPTSVIGSPNATAAEGQVLGISVEIPPARGLAYAGPVVMSFGCFAVVFACVVVCETRDRVLETMDDRVRRGLPARPPGGIDADFYTLVVEFRKRRMERQRRRRRLMRCDGDDDTEPHVEQTTSPLQPTPSTADFQSPSTINDFVDDRADDAQPMVDQHLPTVRLEEPEAASDITAFRDQHEELPTLWWSNPSFSDTLCSKSVDVELGEMAQSFSPVSTHGDGQTVQTLSPSWKPAAPLTTRSCLSTENDVLSKELEPTQQCPTTASWTVPPAAADDHVTTTSQSLFPLLAPISSMTQTQTLPYVRLEVGSDPPPPPYSTSPTYLIHAASVHRDRSPDVVPQPGTTSFEFPPTDFRRSCDVTTSGGAVASDDRRNSETYADDKSVLVASVRNAVSYADNNSFDVEDLGRHGCVELSDQLHGERSHSFDGLPETSVAAVDLVPTPTQTKRRHCRPNSDGKRTPVAADRMASTDDDYSTSREWSPRSADDGGPSRKRTRGITGHPRRQVHSSPAAVGDSTPLSLPTHFGFPGIDLVQPSANASPYLIAGGSPADPEAGAVALSSDPLCRAPSQDGSNAVGARRRRPNGARHLLAIHRRRRRPDRGDHATASVSTLPRNFDMDADRGLYAAHHSADEVECLLSSTSSAREKTSDIRTKTDDGSSPLIWLRRRTTATTSPHRPHRRTSDPFQATV